MKLSKLAMACAALAFAHTTPAMAQETPAPEAEVALAREIVDLGFPVDQREALFFASMDQMTGQMRQAVLKSMPAPDEGSLAILDNWIAKYISDSKNILRGHIPALMDAFVIAYADMFSEQELRDLRNFLATPSGKGFLQRSSKVLANPHFAKANQDYMDAIMARLPAAQADLRDQLEAHLAEQAAKAEAQK